MGPNLAVTADPQPQMRLTDFLERAARASSSMPAVEVEQFTS